MKPESRHNFSYWCLVGNGWVDLGVAGMMKLLVIFWIIPENSLLSTSNFLQAADEMLR